MNTLTKRDKRTNLDKEIDSIIEVLNKTQPASDEYKTISANLKTLYEAKAAIKNKNISADVLANIAGNLIGLVLILNYEKIGVITSKALGFVIRNRV